MTGAQRLIASSGCATESRGCEHQNQESRRNGGATHGIFLDALAPSRLAVRPTFQVTGGSFRARVRVTGYPEAIQKSSLSERLRGVVLSPGRMGRACESLPHLAGVRIL